MIETPEGWEGTQDGEEISELLVWGFLYDFWRKQDKD